MLFDSRTGIDLIERKDCLALLATTQIGRLAILDGAEPLILPVNHAVVDETIVFRTGEGSKLDAANGGPACFEIDGIEPASRSGWSVVVRGHLHEVTAHDQQHLDQLGDLPTPWVGERSHVVQLQPWSITGRRLRPNAAEDPSRS